jgi:AcrR family transcriptional regulator
MTGVARTRGPYAKGVARRRQIAEAVLELVIEKGHRLVTSLEVSERVAVSEATVLYHYPTKEALLVAALKRHEERELESRRTLDTFDAAGVLAAHGLERLNVARLFVAMAGEASDPAHPAFPFFKNHYQAIINNFSRHIRDRQAEGLADPSIDAVAAARQITAVWDGLQSQWLTTRDFNIGAELTQAMRLLTGEIPRNFEPSARPLSPESLPAERLQV